ncbi:hypothetical protein HDU98_002749 [Podochytrium sp. JEL0797]|nr:hypothetical protein HDU98_002749 [Podochytrium sp. JEL0797]
MGTCAILRWLDTVILFRTFTIPRKDDRKFMSLPDFTDALTQVKASVTERDLDLYAQFDEEFGSSSGSG